MQANGLRCTRRRPIDFEDIRKSLEGSEDALGAPFPTADSSVSASGGASGAHPHKPPLLVVWGDKNPFFLPPGARAYARDTPDAKIHFLDTGHFALDTHHREVAELMRDFLSCSTRI